MICVVRMGSDHRTKAYLDRRLVEGKSKWEIMRCLKRYIAREVYRVLFSSVLVRTKPIGTTSRVVEAEIVKVLTIRASLSGSSPFLVARCIG
jgi:hypothetical protein